MAGDSIRGRLAACCVVALAIGISVSNCALGDVIVDQPHDFIAFSPAEKNTAVPLAQTADDFYSPGGKFFLQQITADFIVTWPNAPEQYLLEIHLGPTPGFRLFDPFASSNVEDLGAWNGSEDLHHVRVTFPMFGEILGQKDHYWVVPYALGNGSGTDRAWWGTAGKAT